MICAVCIARCGVDFGGNDPGTFRRHGTRGGTTNSGPRTGDQSDHSIKACHVSPPRLYRQPWTVRTERESFPDDHSIWSFDVEHLVHHGKVVRAREARIRLVIDVSTRVHTNY